MASSAFWRGATAAQLQALYESLGATEAGVARDVAALREWMAKQPHFPTVPDSANPWLAKYLIRCKNSMERTKDALDYLFTGRNTMPEFFLNRDPTAKDIQDSFDQVHLATMPALTPAGERVHVYAYPAGADASLFDVPALFKRVLMKAELLMRDDLSSAEILIIDLHNGSPSRLAQFTTHSALLKRFANEGLKMYPARLRQIHFVNAPPFTAMILNLLSLVLKDKLFKRITVHGPGLQQLREIVPLDSLPSDYGGNGPSIQEANRQWKDLLVANRDWYKTLENVKTDESKRVEFRRSITDDIIGCPGSFRQLTVD